MAEQTSPHAQLDLLTERLGPLPLLNHFIDRAGVLDVLARHVDGPDPSRRSAISHAQALGVLLRSIVVEREPVYRQHETAASFATGLFGVSAAELKHLSDDRIGRALDRLFQIDRAALLTEVIVNLARRFGVRFERLHNDSTSVSFCGQYRSASGRRVGGRVAPAITYGYSKDHRPDLKQLLFILTIDGEDGVPVHFRCADGNVADVSTHIDTWNALREIAGRVDFLYVADSKLCSRQNMDHIARQGGRFVTVMPRNRQEDTQFRRWIQTNTPAWELVWQRPNPRHADGPRDDWYVFSPEAPSAEAYPIVWVWSTLLTLKHGYRRQKNVAAAIDHLVDIKRRLGAARARLRGAAQIDLEVQDILARHHAVRYLKVTRVVREEHIFRQVRRGRPGPDTAYRKITKRRYDIEWALDTEAIAYDQKSDGMYPLMTNDRSLSPAQVLVAHKGQPRIEKRFEQIKSVHEIAPVFLKNEARIEALFTVYFLALVIQALIERELRLAMKRQTIDSLPIYPESRACRRPTTEHLLRLFSLAERHILLDNGNLIKTFEPELTALQTQVLGLLGVPITAYRRTR
ncbi:MAG: IS1634 family transposase [Burkholderiaceae bacterium]